MNLYLEKEVSNNKLEYTILFQPRSGSTLLCELLSSTGVLGFPQESFSNNWIEKMLKEKNISVQNDLYTYIEEMKRLHITPNGVYGHKVSVYHIETFFKQKDFFSFYSTENIFYLTRKNKIYQAISDYIASETNEWAKFKNLKEKNEKENNIEYDSLKIKQKFAYHINNELKIKDIIKKKNIQLKRVITYEELCNNTDLIIHYFFRDLGIDQIDKPIISINQTNIQKQRTDINDVFAKRFLSEEIDFIEKKMNLLKDIDYIK